MFLLAFLVGMMGFVAMVALGALRGGHGGGHSHSSTHSVGHGHPAPIRAGQHQSVKALKVAGGQSTPFVAKLLGTLSPVNIFSLALGYGATGMILSPIVGPPMIYVFSALGGLVFTFGMVRPLMGFLGGFASKPSEGIESMVYQEAEAITGFDPQGRGLVRLTLDGQHIQLLATLDLLEIQKGIQVRKGEKLLITEVDSARNSCRVTRELAS